MAEEVTATRPHLRQAIELAGGHFVSTIEMGVLKTFVDYKVFDMIPDEGDISFPELAEKVNGEDELLERFSNFLIAAGILTSPTPGRVAHTDKSRAYKSGEVPSGFIVHVFNMLFRPVAQLPNFFSQHGLASPKDARVTPMGLAMGHPTKNVYEILDAEPELAKLFNSFLKQSSRIYTLKDIYDFNWVQGTLDDSRPIVVDVGGSSGRAVLDILSFNEFIPATRCVVFDIPHVIEDTKNTLDEGLSSVQLVGGSMFEPYPGIIHGALIYQFRRVLNDFPDDDVLRALRKTREASATDTRVLIIEELLAADMNKFSVAQDLTLFCVGGKRRDAAMYSKLAGSAGFRLNNQFHDKVNNCGVLEFVLA